MAVPVEPVYNENTDKIDSLKTYISVIQHEIKYLRTKPAHATEEHISNTITLLEHRVRKLKQQKDDLEYREKQGMARS